MTALANCPFCGVEAQLTIPSELVVADCADIYVACDECEAEGAHVVVEMRDRGTDLWPEDRAEAIAAWNRRAALAHQPGPAQGEDLTGYRDAFYELADLLCIGAQPFSPSEVWRVQMMPTIKALMETTPPALRPDDSAGVVTVPREPTEAMLRAGIAEMFGSANEDWADDAKLIWDAMVNASPRDGSEVDG